MPKMIYQIITNHQELNLLIQRKIMNRKYMSHPEYLFTLLSRRTAVKSMVWLLHIFTKTAMIQRLKHLDWQKTTYSQVLLWVRWL